MARSPRRTRGAIILGAISLAIATLVTLPWGGGATAAPSVSQLRGEVQRIQAEVAAIDEQVGMAAEAYNGAVYQLGVVNRRIAENRAALARATARLHREQDELGKRLLAAYRQPPPTRIQLILSSSSASALASGNEAMERAAAKDGEVIRAVKALRQERMAKAAQLVKDRAAAKSEVADRAKQRAVVEGLLRRRQAVLAGAKGRLAQELAAEQAREAARRREANRRARALIASRSSAATAPAAQPTPASSAPSSGSSATVSGAGSARNAQAARVAMRYLGVPYRWGGSTPSGFDCSGLAMYAYGHVGVSMAHYTGAIWSAYPKVSGPLQPGDLVFFSGLGHMGIYIGGGMMVHAPHTGDVVRVAPIAGRSYVGAVRP